MSMATSTTSSSITPTSRPASTTVATVSLVLSALVDFSYIAGYRSGAPIPIVIVALEVCLGVMALVAAVGLWGQRRWAFPLALVLAVLTLLLGAMGLVSATSMTGKIVGALSVLLGSAVIALVAPRAARWAAD